ncbi:MAG: FecR domain-containing protein [Mangrovibacterium sp.]|nr:FecR domain-containing protein [Mangrovibacterium sp.]
MNDERLNNEELFSGILSGNASPEQREAFDLWLSATPKNRKAFEAYKKVWDWGGHLKPYDLKEAKLKTQIKIFEKLKEKKGFMYYWQRVAAVLILPVIVFSALQYHSGNTKMSTVPLITTGTPFGARTSLLLPDGSTVWLNSGSEISYPRSFGKIREIMLKGEMYLEVEKNGKPFVVKTDFGEVAVLGTKFNVSSYTGEPFSTTLVEGSVAVKDKANSDEILLKPGFQYASQNGKYSIKEVPVNAYTSWKDGKMIFRREPFEIVAKRLERWFNVTIELKGESIKNLWYTGAIEMESFSEVLELIKNTTPIAYSFNPNTRVLTISKKD